MCGEFDQDVCLEWGPPVDCDAGLVCNFTSGQCRQPYPAGPYGTQYGDTIANLCFESGACGQAGHWICLDQFLGRKATLIAVHTGWCPTCQTQLAGAEGLEQTYQADGFETLQVLFEDDRYVSTRSALLIYACEELKDYGLTFPVVIDPAGSATQPYFDGGFIPLNIIVDEHMVIRYKLEDYDPATLVGTIEQLLYP